MNILQSFIIVLGVVAAASAIGAPVPPKVAQTFQQNFTLKLDVGILHFDGYSYFDYFHGGGFTQFEGLRLSFFIFCYFSLLLLLSFVSDALGLHWTGVANTDANNQSTLYYWSGNNGCAKEGPFNKTELDELFRWEIPDNATFLGYQGDLIFIFG